MVFPDKKTVDSFSFYSFHIFYKIITWNLHVKNMEFFKTKEGDSIFLRKYIKVPWKTHGTYMVFM